MGSNGVPVNKVFKHSNVFCMAGGLANSIARVGTDRNLDRDSQGDCITRGYNPKVKNSPLGSAL